MSFKNTILKPTQNVLREKIVDEYRTDFTGQAGHLVKVSQKNPDDDSFYAQNTPLGASFDGIYSNKWISPYVVTKAEADDPANALLGITLQGTAEFDQHGNKINGFNRRYADENNYVASGEPVQIAAEGNFYISIDQIEGVPGPQSGLVAADEGKFRVVDPKVAGYSESGLLVGKCFSTSGTRQRDVNIYVNV